MYLCAIRSVSKNFRRGIKMITLQAQLGLCCRSSLLLVVLLSGGHALALDKKTILKKLEAAQVIKESYSAKLHSKMMMANRVVTDSGRLEVLAPNCQKMMWSSVTQ